MSNRKNKYFFPVLTLVVAISLAIVVGYVSVTGLGKTFPGGGVIILIMAGIFEFGKVIGTTYLHRNTGKHRDDLEESDPNLKGVRRFFDGIRKRILNILMTIAVIVVMGITSFGIYGFLSAGYMETATKLEKNEKQISLVEKKIEIREKKITTLEDSKGVGRDRMGVLNEQRKYQEARVDTLIQKGWYKSAREARGQIDDASNEIKGIISENSRVDSIIQVEREGISNMEIEKVELSNSDIAGEVGPLKYIAELTGKSMAVIINYFIIAIMFVLDPFAVLLILAANREFDKARKKNDLEPTGIDPPKKEEEEKDDFEFSYPYSPESDEKEDIEEVAEEIEGTIEEVAEEIVEEVKEVAEEVTEEEAPEVMVIVDGETKPLLSNDAEEFFKSKKEGEDKFKEKVEKMNEENFYLKLLSVLFRSGEVKKGEDVLTYSEFVGELKRSDIDTEKNKVSIRDFLKSCNILNIIDTDKNKRVALNDYESSREIIKHIKL